MIKMVQYGSRHAPRVVCDYCGEIIENCLDGKVEFKVHNNQIIEEGRVYFTHKHCNVPFETANKPNGAFIWATNGLGEWLVYLTHNEKANTEFVHEIADTLEHL